ncbi:lipoprotein-releasing system permease protein [Chitinophaga sp. CF118]|uniref:ABC transporter permease n=1 Tax=Chitinophaga sp. CF118 TaxID=1884367 RepID=UPI0008E7F72A|nr:FtsX-like permease family protein [Chitinophaga sp. CF118]SFE59162.1 lipoprotein-releasing system permease protein [Chitinophaga sp. CF118]
MKKSINTDIAFTHIITRKRQTLVAALGVTIGVGVYLFMNSLSSGFGTFSKGEMFKNSPHIKIYKADELSLPLISSDSGHKAVIINPQITTNSKKIINPEELLSRIKQQPYVVNAIAQVSFDAFYNRGKAQLRGNGYGINILEYDAMFKTGKYIVAGSLNRLSGNLNGIIIGSGIAEKLNLGVNDNITVTSSYNVVKVMKIVGIYSSGNSLTDNAKSYMNISAAQQFIKEGPSYVSDIFINVPDADNSEKYAAMLQHLTAYKVEDWKTTNADVLATEKTRGTLMGAISLSILVVAAFGIYNILSSTIAQKINDIAILKATGFAGKDVIRIFLMEALIMGFIGTLMGLMVGSILIAIMSTIYMGGPVGYFPIHFEPALFAKSTVLGLFITLCAGYFPARKAAKVDPVEIFRK